MEKISKITLLKEYLALTNALYGKDPYLTHDALCDLIERESLALSKASGQLRLKAAISNERSELKLQKYFS